jgi:hypothetical protein
MLEPSTNGVETVEPTETQTEHYTADLDTTEEPLSESESTSGQANLPQNDNDELSPEEAYSGMGAVPDQTTTTLRPKIVERKPKKTEFFRTNPDPKYHQVHPVVDGGSAGPFIVVGKDLQDYVAAEIGTKVRYFHLAINLDEKVFMWATSLPESTNASNDWSDTETAALQASQQQWVRVWTSKTGNVFECKSRVAKVGLYPDPEWPETPPLELFNQAFQGRIIRRLSHPLLQRLLGEIA